MRLQIGLLSPPRSSVADSRTLRLQRSRLQAPLRTARTRACVRRTFEGGGPFALSGKWLTYATPPLPYVEPGAPPTRLPFHDERATPRSSGRPSTSNRYSKL